MTVRNVVGGVLKLDDTSGILADMSGYVEDVSLTYTITGGMHRVLNNRYAQRTQGKLPIEGQLQFTVIKTDGDDEANDIIKSWVTGATITSKTYELYDDDETAGSEKYTGECVIDGQVAIVAKNANSGDVQKYQVTLPTHGTITESTVAGS